MIKSSALGRGLDALLGEIDKVYYKEECIDFEIPNDISSDVRSKMINSVNEQLCQEEVLYNFYKLLIKKTKSNNKKIDVLASFNNFIESSKTIKEAIEKTAKKHSISISAVKKHLYRK